MSTAPGAGLANVSESTTRQTQRAFVIRHSIVIPTYGRPETLRQCLSACARLSYDRDIIEVVVVDDGNHEATRRVVTEFGHLLHLLYVPQPERTGPAKARNAGAAKASGEYIAFIDDDCAPEPGWLDGLDRVFMDEKEPVAVGGRTLSTFEDNVYATASQNLVDFLYEWYNADPRHARFFASNNFACPRAAFWEISGFDGGFPRAAAEDRDFCDRWREHGHRLVYGPEAVVRHRHRLTFGSFIRQHVGYGRGAVYLHRGRERRGLSRPRLEPMSFYWRLVTYAVGKGFGARTPALVVLAFISQAAYATGYYGERFQQRRLKPASAEPHVTPPAAATLAKDPPEGSSPMKSERHQVG